MSIYIHTTIIVSGSNGEEVDAAHEIARSLDLDPTETQAGRNGFESFCVLPDGNAGGEHLSSTTREIRIASLISGLRPLRVDWCAVRFGVEGGTPEIIDSSSSAQTRAARRWNPKS